MNRGISGILGRTITEVGILEGGSPRSRVFLGFSDGTYYELYCLSGKIEGLSAVSVGSLREAVADGPDGEILAVGGP